MMGLKLLLFLLSTTLPINAKILSCNVLESVEFEFEKSLTVCDSENHSILNRSEQRITSLHKNDTTKPIDGFTALYGYMLFFPRGLGDFNLISIEQAGLKEIIKNDLKGYRKLEYLRLPSNSLKYIKKDLFKFNKNLAKVNLKNNPIVHIDPNVFDELRNKLISLDLSFTLCRKEIGKIEVDTQELNLALNKINGNYCYAENTIKIVDKLNGLTDEQLFDISEENNKILGQMSATERFLNNLTQKYINDSLNWNSTIREMSSRKMELETESKNCSDNYWRAKQGSLNVKVTDDHMMIFVAITCGTLIFSVIVHCCIACNKPKQNVTLRSRVRKVENPTNNLNQPPMVITAPIHNNINQDFRDTFDNYEDVQTLDLKEVNTYYEDDEAIYANAELSNQNYKEAPVYANPSDF